MRPEQECGGAGWLPKQYEIPRGWPSSVRGRVPLDPHNPAVVRDDEKCVLCGQCTEVCQQVQNVLGYYDLPMKGDFVCVHCGQCTLWCPTSAITEKQDTERVRAALTDAQKTVIVQTAPAVRVALGEEFGLGPGHWIQGQLVAALRQIGFDRVFDTSFAADLTIMEESSELVNRLTSTSENIPQFTSCCPAWVKFVEYFYPELLPHLSSAKSPQQMLGVLSKTYYAKELNIDPQSIFNVSIMPCTAKKFEAIRPEFRSATNYWSKTNVGPDLDAVLTVRELAVLLKEHKLNPAQLPEQSYDSLLGESSGAGTLFGNTGGVTEAAIRSAYYLLTGQRAPPQAFAFRAVRGLEGIKTATLEVPRFGPIRVAVASGLKNARLLIEKWQAKQINPHFIEVMACQGGCICGGGTPRSSVPPSDSVRSQRIASLEKRDASLAIRESHENLEIKAIYKKFLGEPLGPIAQQLLHTHYISRSQNLNAIIRSNRSK